MNKYIKSIDSLNKYHFIYYFNNNENFNVISKLKLNNNKIFSYGRYVNNIDYGLYVEIKWL